VPRVLRHRVRRALRGHRDLGSARVGSGKPMLSLSKSSQLRTPRGATLTRVAKSGHGSLTLGVPVRVRERASVAARDQVPSVAPTARASRRASPSSRAQANGSRQPLHSRPGSRHSLPAPGWSLDTLRDLHA
jgi:hypothetical protein